MKQQNQKNMKEAVKPHMVCISSNKDRHPAPKTRHPVHKSGQPIPNLILFAGVLSVLDILIFHVKLNDATLKFQTL